MKLCRSLCGLLVRRRYRGRRAGVGTDQRPPLGQAFWWTTGFTALAVLDSFFLPGRHAAEPAQVAPAEVASAEEAAPAAAGQPATADQRR